MQKLIAGLHHFQSDVFPAKRALFEKLAHGQSPEALFITCSDSRINPAMLTNTEPGDLFIMRNAGNIIPAYSSTAGGEQATVEFAVSALGVKHIVVCGHSQCGAMKGLLQPETLENLPAVKGWLAHAESTRRLMRENYGHLHGEDLLTATVEENVLVQLENLRTHPSVHAALARRTLSLHAWVYKLESGQVFTFDPETHQFLSLGRSNLPPASAAAGLRATI